jgi:hypothetical protein
MKRERVHDEHVFEKHPQPLVPVVFAVGLHEELGEFLDAVPLLRRQLVLGILQLDDPAKTLHLILAGLDDETQKIVAIGEGAKRLVGDRRCGTLVVRTLTLLGKSNDATLDFGGSRLVPWACRDRTSQRLVP